MSTSDRLNIVECPDTFGLIKAYFNPAVRDGPHIDITTGKDENSKTFWTATVHNCVPISAGRDEWMLTGYISVGTGGMGNDSRPYEALVRPRGKPGKRGWLRLLEGDVGDHLVRFTTFGELEDGEIFLYVGIASQSTGKDCPSVMRKQGNDAHTVQTYNWCTGIDPNQKVVSVWT